MFTGLIEALGTVKALTRAAESAELRLDVGPLREGTGIGDSLAIDGVCLTVTSLQGAVAAFDVSTETLARTTLGSLTAGRTVNLERALRVGDRLGGHFVLGHVDAVGALRAKRPSPGQVTIEVSAPPEILSQLIPKGSIAVDGISLTIADLQPDHFAVAVIPHTLEHTTLKHKSPGDPVNIESDVIGKYVRRLLQGASGKGSPQDEQGLSVDFLQQHGFQ